VPRQPSHESVSSFISSRGLNSACLLRGLHMAEHQHFKKEGMCAQSDSLHLNLADTFWTDNSLSRVILPVHLQKNNELQRFKHSACLRNSGSPLVWPTAQVVGNSHPVCRSALPGRGVAIGAPRPLVDMRCTHDLRAHTRTRFTCKTRC